jgi:hypothetical protein|tara:strand:- start:660 stop:1031 length:372 start_codon:yes stop_codon:yes gene_type:complete
MLSFKDLVTEVLDVQQRRKLAMRMKRNKSRIAIARKRSEKKIANMDTLKKRARRQARSAVISKLTKGKDKGEMSIARKKDIEKRLERPALQSRIDRQAKKLVKVVRKQEIERKRNRSRGGDNK